MSTKHITIEIDEQGNCSLEAHGYTNGECRTATEALEEALGQVSSREMKKGGACVRQTVKAGAK